MAICGRTFQRGELLLTLQDELQLLERAVRVVFFNFKTGLREGLVLLFYFRHILVLIER